MKTIKLYNAEGKQVEAFKLCSHKNGFVELDGRLLSKNAVMHMLNGRGLFMRKQLAPSVFAAGRKK